MPLAVHRTLRQRFADADDERRVLEPRERHVIGHEWPDLHALAHATRSHANVQRQPKLGELKDLEATNSFLRLYSAIHLAMFSMCLSVGKSLRVF